MKTSRTIAAIMLMCGPAIWGASESAPAQSPAAGERVAQATAAQERAAQEKASAPRPASAGAGQAAGEDKRAEAYYYFALGRYFEEEYESSSRSEHATQSIENYKKALELDPGAAVISERLAEVYARTQRIRDAVLEAQEIIKRDPDNLAARRLLARIYVRTLGNLSAGTSQRDTVARAAEQYREILRLEPRDTQAALWLARLYRLQNEHDKAEQVLRNVLETQPAEEDALEQLSALLLDQGKPGEAIALLEKAGGQMPSGGLLRLLGAAYAQTRDYARAEQAYRRAIEAEPGEAAHYRGLADALVAQQKEDAALEQYARLAEMDPSDPENFLRMAQICRRLKRYDCAETSLDKARQRAPGSMEVAYNRALLHESRGQFDDAIRVLSGAVASVKAQTQGGAENRRMLGALYEQLGRLYREVEKYPAAVQTLLEMQSLGEDEGRRARMLLIDTLRAGKQMDRALEESRKALEAAPGDRGLQAAHALLLAENGRSEEAAKQLRGLLEGSRRDRDIYITLAQVCERGRQYAEAEEALRLAERLGDRPVENEMVWFLFGAVFERQKKFDRAEEYFRKVLEVNPRNAQALNYFGYMLADLGVRLDEAVGLVTRALEEEPYNGAFLDSLGWAYFRQGKLAEAEDYLQRAVARSQYDPTIRDHLGDVLAKLGRVDQAAAQWERGLTEWQRSLPAEREVEKVAELEKKLNGLKHRLAQQPGSEPKPK